MGWMDDIAARFGYTKRANNPVTPMWARVDAAAARWDVPDLSLYEAQSDLYRRLSWMQIAVSLLAATAATVPFQVYRRSAAARSPVANHPFELLLDQPNPEESRYELLESLAAYYAITGNGYLFLNRSSPDVPPAELWTIPSRLIRPVPDERMGVAGYEFDASYGGIIRIPRWQICHIKRFNPLNRFVGLSPIEALAVAATGDMAAQQWNTNYFGKENGKLPGALAFADPINEPDWKTIKGDIKEQWGGVNRSGPLLLRNVGKGGVEWVPMGMSQQDMQFLEGRSFTKREIYDLVAPGLSSMLDPSSTEASSKTGKGAFLEFAVWPLLDALGQKFSNDILPTYDQRSPRALIGSFDDVRPTDRALAVTEATAAAEYLTIDEVRARYFDLEPLAGGRGAGLTGDRETGRQGAASLKRSASWKQADHRGDRRGALLPSEAALVDVLRGALEAGGSSDGLRGALVPTITAVMADAVNEALEALGAADLEPPLDLWVSEYVSWAVGQVGAAWSQRGAAGAASWKQADRPDPWGWLGMLAVWIIVRARAAVQLRLQAWAKTARTEPEARPLPDAVVVWVTQKDDRVCSLCEALDGMPSDLWEGKLPGDVHPWCRCSSKVVVL